jgi:ribosomal-protein-alanine N-acetyltransferase
MHLIEYEEKYLEDVRYLLVELEEYILTVDEDELDQLHPEYREKMALIDLKDVNENNGKCYLAIEDNKVLGFIQIENHLEITDIINIAVDKDYQGKGIGKKLIQYVIDNTEADKLMLEVKANNDSAINLYKAMGFNQIHIRPNYYEGNIDALIMERSI